MKPNRIKEIIKAKVLHENNLPVSTIARILGVTNMTIYKWRKRNWYEEYWTDKIEYYGKLSDDPQGMIEEYLSIRLKEGLNKETSGFYKVAYGSLYDRYQNGIITKAEYDLTLQDTYKRLSEDGRKLFYKGLVIALIQENKSASEIHDEILAGLGVEVNAERIEQLIKIWRDNKKAKDSIGSINIENSDISLPNTGDER